MSECVESMAAVALTERRFADMVNTSKEIYQSTTEADMNQAVHAFARCFMEHGPAMLVLLFSLGDKVDEVVPHFRQLAIATFGIEAAMDLTSSETRR